MKNPYHRSSPSIYANASKRQILIQNRRINLTFLINPHLPSSSIVYSTHIYNQIIVHKNKCIVVCPNLKLLFSIQKRCKWHSKIHSKQMVMTITTHKISVAKLCPIKRIKFITRIPKFHFVRIIIHLYSPSIILTFPFNFSKPTPHIS